MSRVATGFPRSLVYVNGRGFAPAAAGQRCVLRASPRLRHVHPTNHHYAKPRYRGDRTAYRQCCLR